MSEYEERYWREEGDQGSRGGTNGGYRPANDADRIRNIVREVLSEQANRDIGAEKAKTTDPEEEKKAVIEAVGNANTLAARKTAVATAVETARDDEAEQESIATAVSNASHIEARATSRPGKPPSCTR
jgi:DNA-binding IscR family transcriptional regulator